MRKKMVILTVVFVLGFLGTASAAEKCDRACLVALMDQYLAAVVKHNPAGVPIASDVKLVENLNATPIGKGLWETATGGPTEFKIYVADPVAGQIGFHGRDAGQGQAGPSGRPFETGKRQNHRNRSHGVAAE